MFPKINQNINSLSAQSLPQYQSAQSQTPLRNYQILSQMLNHSTYSNQITNQSNNNSNTNIFSRQLNDSRYSSKKWIVNKIDSNTSRITNNYKKDYSPLFQSKSERNSEIFSQLDSPQLHVHNNNVNISNNKNINNTNTNNNNIINRRRRRIHVKQIYSLDCSDNLNILQDSQMSDQQPRQQLDNNSFQSIQESPLKQRKINRSMLYIKSDQSQDITNEDMLDLEKSSCEQQIRNQQPARARQSSLQGLFQDYKNNKNNDSDDSIFKKPSSQSNVAKYTSFFANRPSGSKIRQTSIQIIESEKDNDDDSQMSTNETEESMYNFKYQNQKIILPPVSKGILKNSSENYIKSPFKKQSKKQVSFNIIKKIF